MGKSKMLPKVLLTEKVLEHLNEFYASNLPSDVLFNDCFSNPFLHLHFCNIEAPANGNQKCPYCNHTFGRRCKITCDIHHFCLATFAYRLGIGKGDELWDAVEDNLSLKYVDLKKKVMYALKGDPPEESETQPEAPKETVPAGKNPFVKSSDPVKESEKPKNNPMLESKPSEKSKGDPVVEANPKPVKALDDTKKIRKPVEKDVPLVKDDDLLNLQEAADLYGCKYFNIYSHVKRGNLTKVESPPPEKKLFVRKSEVLALRLKNKGRKNASGE